MKHSKILIFEKEHRSDLEEAVNEWLERYKDRVEVKSINVSAHDYCLSCSGTTYYTATIFFETDDKWISRW